MRIAVFKGQSQYDVLRHFSDALANGFIQLGCEVIVIDLLDKNFSTNLVAAVKTGLGAIIAPNGIGIELKTNEGESLYDKFGIKYIACFVDHPIIHAGRILKAPANSILTFIDKTHVEFASKFFSTHGAIHYFLPHGGAGRNGTERNGTELNLQLANTHVQRTKNIMFSGTFKQYTLDNAKNKKYPAFFTSLLISTYDEMKKRKDVSFHSIFDDVLKDTGIYLANPDKKLELIQKIFSELNIIRGSENRLHVLEAFNDRAVYVDIYGPAGWKDFCKNRSHLRYKGVRNYNEILQLQRDYKFIINDNNDFLYGSHERHFDALSNGACPISPINGYYASAAHASGLGLFYERDNIDAMVSGFFNSKASADSTYQEFETMLDAIPESQKIQWSWVHRAAELYNLLEM